MNKFLLIFNEVIYGFARQIITFQLKPQENAKFRNSQNDQKGTLLVMTKEILLS